MSQLLMAPHFRRLANAPGRLMRQTPAQYRGMFALILLSLLWSRMSLGPRPFDIFDNDWLWGDLAQVYYAWSAYMDQASIFPLTTDRFSQPLDLSISLFDPMPILLLFAKPFAWLFPDGSQYFGYYFALCIMLQGIFAYLAISEILRLPNDREAASRPLSVFLQIAGAIIIMTAPYTLIRFTGHTALSSQWLLVMSIWVALRTRDVSGWKWYAANGSALFLSTGFNPYLAIMCGMSLAIIPLWQARLPKLHVPALRVLSLAIAGLFGLSVFGFISGAGVSQSGFGVFSMNILGPIDSNGSGSLLGLDIKDATTGQTFEGFTYLGLGSLLAIVLAGLALYRSKIDRDLPLWAGASVILAATLIALSNRVTLSGLEFHYELPAALDSLMGRFRGSGRFFWIAGFWLNLLAVAVLIRRFGQQRSALALIPLALIQWIDVAGVAVDSSKGLNAASRLSIAADDALLQHADVEVIKVFPPWQCDPFHTPGGVRNYEIISSLALKLGASTNSFYAARTPAEHVAYHCNYDERVPELDRPGIYIYSNAIYAAHQSLIDARLRCQPHPSFPESVVCS